MSSAMFNALSRWSRENANPRPGRLGVVLVSFVFVIVVCFTSAERALAACLRFDVFYAIPQSKMGKSPRTVAANFPSSAPINGIVKNALEVQLSRPATRTLVLGEEKETTVIGLALVMAVASSSINDQSFITGAELLKQCQAKNELQFACNGYITGVSDAHGVYDYALKRSSICYPDGTSIADISAAVVGFLSSKPDHLQDGAAGLVLAALLQRFPCHK